LHLRHSRQAFPQVRGGARRDWVTRILRRRTAGVVLVVADIPEEALRALSGADLGVYEEARRRGLRVPEDLSVVGFDDLAFTGYLTPPLTTVHQPHRMMAAEAVRLVLSMPHNEPSTTPVRVELATSLVVRASTCPPADGRPADPASRPDHRS